MFRNYFVINLILLVIIGLLGFRSYKVWVRPLDIPIEVTQQKSQTDKKDIVDKKELNLDETLYQVIVQKDLFRPARSAPRVEETSKTSFPQEPPRLFGTVIMDNEKSAILEDPSTKTTRLYHINDSVSGFIISDIQKDKVILLKGSEKIEVQLRDMKVVTPSRPSPYLPQPPRRPQEYGPRRQPKSPLPPSSPPPTQPPLAPSEVTPPPPQEGSSPFHEEGFPPSP